jgi:2-oxoglutarate dehydrogenase E2 component (dihydrolipoamide succinyltransferase)
MADIQMPQLGETVTEGTITKWFKAVGDEVTEDEPLFEVSTDKVDSEVPAPSAGFLVEIRVPEGETVDVGTVLAVIGDSADGAGEAPAAEAPAEEAPSDEAPAEEAPAEEAEPAAEAPAEPEPEPAPEEPKAEEPQAEESSAAHAAPDGGDTDVAPAGAAPASAGEGLLLSPVVRRLITEHDLDPASIQGTGAGGRITRNDVLKLVEGGEQAPAPAAAEAPAAKAAPAPASAPKQAPPIQRPEAAPAAAGRSAAPAPSARAGERDSVEPLNNIRKRTGEHMVRSKATSPHVLTVMEVDFERVEQARRAHRDEFKATEGFSLTYLPFIARALIDAIDEFPHMNATVGEGELIVHNYVNLGIAVDLNYEGLIVPVIHEAQDKRLAAIAREISNLASRARGKKLSADDISGGTVTITNAGQYGTFVQAAVINQPQVMILSTEGVSRRPVVVTDAFGAEAIAIHSVGYLSMTWDHRAFDGAYAAAFLSRVREIIETRDWEVEL